MKKCNSIKIKTPWAIFGIHRESHKKKLDLRICYDIRENGDFDDENASETCMMCQHDRIRYVHVVTHTEVEEEFKIVCICTEKITNDYFLQKKHEQSLRNKYQRCIKKGMEDQ